MLMNKYDLNSENPLDVRTALTLQRKYQMYSLSAYRFVAVSCSANHFFVISLAGLPLRPGPWDALPAYAAPRPLLYAPEQCSKAVPSTLPVGTIEHFFMV